MVDWAEKYRPTTLKDVVGNPKAVQQLETWARSWEKKTPKKRAAILAGEPGVGKTTAAHALAQDMGWGLVEMNASDARNAAAIRAVATRGALAETFTSAGEYVRSREGGRKLIVLDEADNLAGREDMGGVAAITDTIRRSSQPIVLIVNDLYELTRRSSSLKSLAETIKFQRISLPSVQKVLRQVAHVEGVPVDNEVVDFIAERSGGDLRSALNDLQALAEGRSRVGAEALDSLGYRDVRGEIYGALTKVFRSGRFKEAAESTDDLDEDPNRVLLWIDENLPFEYREPGDLLRGYSALSRADEYLGRVRRRQRYSFWSYATDMMTGGVAVARHGRYSGAQYRFPLWLSKMSRSRSLRATVGSLCLKLARSLHTTSRRIRSDVLTYFTELYLKDVDFRLNATRELGLEEAEVAFLLDEDEDSRAVRQLLEHARAGAGEGGVKPFHRFEGEG